MSRGILVFVHSSDELYGADRMLLEMVQALPDAVRRRTQVWLPTDLEHPANPLCVELERRGVAVRHVDLPILRRAYRSPGALLRLAGRATSVVRELRAAGAGTVYCATSATFLVAPAARLAGARSVIGHVQEIWPASDRRVLGPLARSAHRLVAISRPVAASLPRSLAARTTVVTNATPEPASWSPVPVDGGPLTYLMAGRWNGWKGHGTLLAAWELAGAPGRLVILGGPPPSGDAVDVRALAARLTDPGSVEVVGEVTDASPYVEAADVMVVPSDQPEPFGLVAIEAFARGRPVIGSAAGGLADIIDDATSGWLFPPGDAAALADVLRHLTRGTVATAGLAARGTYEQRYTPARFAAAWRTAVGLSDA